MSKGLGRLQAAICEALAGGARYRGEVCWAIAEREDAIDEDGITGRFYNAFSRAVRTLTSPPRSRVCAEKRKILSFDELVSHFPFKTRSRTMRDLRVQLLPVLRDLEIAEPDSAEHQFSTAGQEDYIVKRMRQGDKAIFQAAQARWTALQGSLLSLGSYLRDSESQRAWVRLLAKGAELFEDRASIFEEPHAISVEASIVRVLSSCEAIPERSEDDRIGTVLGEVRHFFDQTITERQRCHTQLKNELYSIVDFSQRGRSHMREAAKHFLLKRFRPILEGLPGHVPSPTRSRGSEFFKPDETVFSPILDQLLDRHCLEPFEFLSLAPVGALGKQR